MARRIAMMMAFIPLSLAFAICGGIALAIAGARWIKTGADQDEWLLNAIEPFGKAMDTLCDWAK